MELRVNGNPFGARPALRLQELLAEVGVGPDGDGVAVALNETVVPQHEWGSRILNEGDRVEIVRPVQGG